MCKCIAGVIAHGIHVGVMDDGYDDDDDGDDDDDDDGHVQTRHCYQRI